MEQKDQYSERIRNYLLDLLSLEEREAFESDMLENLELQQEVRLQKSLMHIIRDEMLEDAAANIRLIKNRLEEKKQAPAGSSKGPLWRRRVKNKWSIAASLLIILALASLGIYLFNPDKASVRLSREALQRIPASFDPMTKLTNDLGSITFESWGTQNNETEQRDWELFEFVLSDFQQNNLANAQLHLDSLPEGRSNLIPLYRGLIAYRQQEYESAVDHFTKVQSDASGQGWRSSLSYDANSVAQWYLALSYFHLGQADQAKERLEFLVKQPWKARYDGTREIVEQSNLLLQGL